LPVDHWQELFEITWTEPDHHGVGKDALSRICREFSLDTRVVGSDTGSGDLIFLGINAGAVVHLKIILSTFSWIFVSWTDVS
jgi:hypothetical protein